MGETRTSILFMEEHSEPMFFQDDYLENPPFSKKEIHRLNWFFSIVIR